MEASQQKKVFVPPGRRLLISRLKSELLEIVMFILLVVLFIKPDIQFTLAAVLMLCIIKAFRVWRYSKKDIEQSEVIISGQDICGLPSMPWFNGFRAVEKISIPLNKIDKRRTGTLKRGWWSGIFVWSIDGKNILLSNDFEKEQLREIAELIGCPVEQSN